MQPIHDVSCDGAESIRVAGAVPAVIRRSSDVARRSPASYRSLWSVLSAGSVLSVASATSMLSIGSFMSILSIGSSNSVLSIGSDGGFLSIGKSRSKSRRRERLGGDGALTADPVRPLRR